MDFKSLRNLAFVVLAEQLDVSEEKIDPKMLLIADLGADSFDLIEMVMMLEYDMHIDLSDDAFVAFERAETVEDFIKIACAGFGVPVGEIKNPRED